MANTQYYRPEKGTMGHLTLINRDGIMGNAIIQTAVTIGRRSSQSRCDISVASPIVSRIHGEIFPSEGQYYYRDIGSSNGTYLNRKLLGVNQAVPLLDGDVLCFDVIENGKHHPNQVIAIFSTTDISENWRTISLDVSMAEICIGRSVESGLKLDNAAISERHASFFLSSNGWAIIDHQSTNGVYLNGKRITSPRYLDEFDVVRVADCYFVFLGDKLLCSDGIRCTSAEENLKEQSAQIPAQSVEPVRNTAAQNRDAQLVIQIVERSVVQRFKKLLLLQNINISVANGEMVLILGGSGAGKTTFINAVMGYEKADGRIVYQDTDIYEEYEKMKYQIGFVPQQDLLRGSDSVYDTLSNAAAMKLPRSTSEEKREQRIEDVLEQFGLSREKQTLVSKLSGGQRKRLSIAVEFIASPSLFFLDEPDSGLDDIMGRGLMESLRNIADLGKIIMVITHSPERAADLFDKVIVLAKSTKDNCGHLAFYGSVQEAFRFFEVDAFRGIVKRINRPDENGEGLADYYIEKFNALC